MILGLWPRGSLFSSYAPSPSTPKFDTIRPLKGFKKIQADLHAFGRVKKDNSHATKRDERLEESQSFSRGGGDSGVPLQGLHTEAPPRPGPREGSPRLPGGRRSVQVSNNKVLLLVVYLYVYWLITGTHDFVAFHGIERDWKKDYVEAPDFSWPGKKRQKYIKFVGLKIS